MGLGSNPVVIYDNLASKNAARIWWILRYWGVTNVRVVNGGLKAWKAAELPTETKPGDPPEAVTFAAKARKRQLASKEQVLKWISDDNVQILDTRSKDEFCGIDKKENKRGGAIPTATHLEWKEVIDAETDRFKSAEELAKVFDKAGIDLEKPSVSHCQSGGRASVMILALELLGAKSASNYFPGWSEWGNAENDELPVVVSDAE
jgi:thiosulfate/3-mercaptopyruvate sulfurtransferase